MNLEIRLTGVLYRTVLRDLERPHPFAGERVGFLFGRLGSLANQGNLILLNRYHSIPDEEYVKDPNVGARIGVQSISWAMQTVHRGRRSGEGIFHVHVHDHSGEPRMSPVDQDELPPMMPRFQAVGRKVAHGIVILSRDHGAGWAWLPGANEPGRAQRISVIQSPLLVFDRRAPK
jgi:hypothetical protein